MSRFAEVFRQSPFDPLREHMDRVMACVSMVKPMFEAAAAGDHDRLEEITKEVFKTEHQADQIKDEIRRTIPKSFFLPVYRGDLLGYLKLQDDMADAAEDLAVLLTIKKLVLPEAIRDGALEYVDKVIRVCRKTYETTGHLKTLVETNFDADEVARIIDMVAGIEKAEWEADRTQYRLSQRLFAQEENLKPADLFLWFRIFGELGQLANFAEKAGDRLRRMLFTQG